MYYSTGWGLNPYFPSPSLEEEGEASFVILSNARKLPCGRRGWEGNFPSGDGDGKK